MDYKQLQEQFKKLKEIEAKRTKDSGAADISTVEATLLLAAMQENLITTSIELNSKLDKTGVFTFEKIIIDEEILKNKFFPLKLKPTDVESVQVFPEGGFKQIFGKDYTIINNQILSFENLGLDGFLELNEEIEIFYFAISN